MKLLLIDGNSIMNRAFYGIRLLSNKKGVFTNALTGFLNIYMKLVKEENPDRIAAAFDLKSPTFRHKMYTDYKAGRHKMPDELAMQMPLIKDILRAIFLLLKTRSPKLHRKTVFILPLAPRGFPPTSLISL